MVLDKMVLDNIFTEFVDFSFEMTRIDSNSTSNMDNNIPCIHGCQGNRLRHSELYCKYDEILDSPPAASHTAREQCEVMQPLKSAP